MTFADPLYLFLLLAVPLALFFAAKLSRRAALRFPTTDWIAKPAPRWARSTGYLTTILRGLALLVLVLALARPRLPDDTSKRAAEGIAIQMLLDTSGSMRSEDFLLDAKPASRLDVVRQAFRDFVAGRNDLAGRPNDLIGLITFARYPDVLCPPTASHDVLLEFLDQTLPASPTDDGTNIGDAIALATERLRLADPREKVMILLTDGLNDPGTPDALDPLEAARIAGAFGIKIYTIGAAANPPTPLPTPGAPQPPSSSPPTAQIDETLLRRIADATGAQYFRAADTAGLRTIYSEIDRLHKTRTEQFVYTRYREFFPHLLLAGLLLVAVEQFLAGTWLRRLP